MNCLYIDSPVWVSRILFNSKLPSKQSRSRRFCFLSSSRVGFFQKGLLTKMSIRFEGSQFHVRKSNTFRQKLFMSFLTHDETVCEDDFHVTVLTSRKTWSEVNGIPSISRNNSANCTLDGPVTQTVPFPLPCPFSRTSIYHRLQVFTYCEILVLRPKKEPGFFNGKDTATLFICLNLYFQLHLKILFRKI